MSVIPMTTMSSRARGGICASGAPCRKPPCACYNPLGTNRGGFVVREGLVMSTSIRRATYDDAMEIAEVHVESWRTTYGGIIDQAFIDNLSVAERAVSWMRRLSMSSPAASDVLVATTPDGSIVGFLSGGLIRAPYFEFDAELHAIYLLASFQRAGLGRRLTREWAAIAITRGLNAAVVRAHADNPACAFYERLGAEFLRTSRVDIGGKSYPERWYGW